MIVRSTPDHFVLIAQHDHAALAAQFLSAWRADGLPAHPLRERILEATRLHDVGWQVEDAAPRVDTATGAPYDFITMPAEHRQAVWPRGVERLDATPYEAALVAQHALTIYRRYEGDPAFEPFFRDMAARRDALYQRCEATLPVEVLATFMQAYAWVSIADLLSLVACHGWTDTFDADHYRVTLSGTRLRVEPDPFDGHEIPWRIAGRRLEARPYTSDADLRAAYAAAPIVWTEGSITG